MHKKQSSPIKISCFGGKAGWNFKLHFPRLASEAYIISGFLMRRRLSRRYISNFFEGPDIPMPLEINIETINRCNSTCDFCPANRNADTRPYARMSEELFRKIIADLKEWGYNGYISLYLNNEPFMDTRTIEFHKYLREQLPDCTVKFYTNGLLMDFDKFMSIIPYIDYMVINNYSETMDMHPNVKQIYEYVSTHPDEFAGKRITVSLRYIHDVLTNRAGAAPNKPAARRTIKERCLLPYTDMAVFADGRLGLCCVDATEVTNLGNAADESLRSLWENSRSDGLSYSKARQLMKNGRHGLEFCRHCDFLDAGIRENLIINKKNRQE